ncbi:MAG: hypothetical protein L0H84_18870, partial [Pseudonocardia sp.]|nr:hypothetical protein [Pseudonocardia sp.]
MDEPIGEHPTRWLAHDQELDREVVVTRVETGTTGAAGEEVAGRAATDIVRKLADVDESTVIAPTDAVLADGELWVVRPSADTTPLTAHRLDERGIARVGADVAGALAAAHAAGVVHGDVREDEIHVRHDGSGALAGFATTAPCDIAPAVAPAHPEPERVADRPAGPATDVYALGVVLGAALERAGGTPSDQMASTLRTMCAEFADARPTAWAAQRRLTTVATSAPTTGPAAPQIPAAPADPTSERVDASNAATSIVTTPAADLAATEVATAVAVDAGGTDPRTAAVPGGPAGQQWWAAAGPPQGPAPAGGSPTPGGNGARRPANAKGWLVAAVAVLATIGTIAGVVSVTEPVVPVAGVAAAPPGTKPPPPSLLGDPSTVDPCSLIEPAAFGGIGRAEVFTGFGHAAECSVGVYRPSDYGYVSATISTKTLYPPSGSPTTDGDLTIYRTSE